MISSERLSYMLGIIIAFVVLFVLPLVLPYAAYLFLAPVGFWQSMIFLMLGIGLYIIALVVIWWIIYCFT